MYAGRQCSRQWWTPYTMPLHQQCSLIILRSVSRGLVRNMPGLRGLQVGWQNGCQLGSFDSSLQCILYVLLCGTAQSLHANCQVICCFGQQICLQKFSARTRCIPSTQMSAVVAALCPVASHNCLSRSFAVMHCIQQGDDGRCMCDTGVRQGCWKNSAGVQQSCAGVLEG